MTQRWKLTLEYDGAGFNGWQRQLDAPSVQQAVEEAIHAFSGETVRLHGAGRTDTGVHALAQAAHFDLERPTDGDTVRDALNHFLRHVPAVVLVAEAVNEDFHARFSAKQRRYVYRVIQRRPPLVLQAPYALHVPHALDLPAMQACAMQLQGTHDFSSFRAQACQSNSPVKTLDEASIEQTGERIDFHFAAQSFLYHQVRNMVGTLLKVGAGRWNVEKFRDAFAAQTRAAGGPTAPPHGLYFVSVTY